MRRTPATAAIIAMAAAIIAIVPVQSASAYVLAPMVGCTTSGDATSTKTTSNVVYPCNSSRARIDKYIQNYPTSYYGNFAANGSDSSIVMTGGVFSGNYFQDVTHNGTATSWYRVG